MDGLPNAGRSRPRSNTVTWTKGLTVFCIALGSIALLSLLSIYFDYRSLESVGEAARRGGLTGRVAKETMKFEAFLYLLLFAKGGIAVAFLVGIVMLFGRIYNAHRMMMMILMSAMIYNVGTCCLAQMIQFSLVEATPGGLPRVLAAQSRIQGSKVSKNRIKALSHLEKTLGSWFQAGMVMIAIGMTGLKCAFYLSLILYMNSEVMHEICTGRLQH